MSQPRLESLMSDVTAAVYRAEGSLKDTIAHYKRLVVAEQAIVDCPEASEEDRKVAQHGVDYAGRILKGIKDAWG